MYQVKVKFKDGRTMLIRGSATAPLSRDEAWRRAIDAFDEGVQYVKISVL